MRKLTPGEASALEAFHAARGWARNDLRRGQITQGHFLARWRRAIDDLADAANGSPGFDWIVEAETTRYSQAHADLRATYHRKEAS